MGFFSLGILTSLQFAWWDVCASPMRSYNKVKVWRDKILDTVNYLQSESAKWKALFTTLKAPYSYLVLSHLDYLLNTVVLALSNS